MNERDLLIQQLIKEKGGTKEQYIQLLDTIAKHESAGTLDPTIIQRGGGPGRGVYQFEKGKNAGAITAARRTKQYYEQIGKQVPSWLKKVTKGNDLDASTLSRAQQDALFLGNMRKHPRADFSKVWKGEETVGDFWANYHWAGDAKDRKKRLASFNDSITPSKRPINKEQAPLPGTAPMPEGHITNPEPVSVNPLSMDNFNSYVENRLALGGSLSNCGGPGQPPCSDGSRQAAMPYSPNSFALGGVTGGDFTDKQITEFNEGGLHEQNPLGGVPLGVGSNGKQNTVEEGEVSYNFKKGKFIFSNRIRYDD